MARGGRKDQPIDRSQGPTAEFVDDLRRLRGKISLEEIGRRMGYHPSTVSRRLNPRELPAWRFVESYVKVCGADVEPWEERWRALSQIGAGDQEPLTGEAAKPRRRGRWLAPAAGAGATVVAGLVLALLLHAPSDETAAVATSASPPPAPDPGYGFATRIDRMAFRVLSREWTQTSAGDVELWWNNSCPDGATTYWVALRPTGEAVRFSCNSWQYRKWAGVPAGTYHLEFWKNHDGRSFHGSGAMRAGVPIIVHPKPVPTPHPVVS